MPSTTTIVQVASSSIALLGSGGILTLTLFDIPELQAQPASRSLPAIRWLFSRGSHIFPSAAAASCAGYAYLAFNSLPAATLKATSVNAVIHTLSHLPATTVGYAVASALCISIAPFTQLVMIPTNFTLIKKNEEKGGYRSKDASKAASHPPPGQRSAEDSVSGKGEGVSQLQDLSGPQERTNKDTTAQDDEEVRQLLGKFNKLNLVRSVLLGAGGVVGLWTAISR